MRSEILSIVAVIGLLPCAGRAQETGGGVACPSIDNDQERLACYDRSMRGGPHAPSPSATPAPSVEAPTNTGSVAAAAATTAVAATAASQASAVGSGTAGAATPSSTVGTAPHTSRNKRSGSPASPGAPPTIDPATGQPTGIMPVVVVSTLVRPGFPTEFTTDKGGVWVQGETKPLPTLPKPPFNAQLEPGTFGGAFLVVPDRKLGVRVRSADR